MKKIILLLVVFNLAGFAAWAGGDSGGPYFHCAESKSSDYRYFFESRSQNLKDLKVGTTVYIGKESMQSVAGATGLYRVTTIEKVSDHLLQASFAFSNWVNFGAVQIRFSATELDGPVVLIVNGTSVGPLHCRKVGF